MKTLMRMLSFVAVAFLMPIVCQAQEKPDTLVLADGQATLRHGRWAYPIVVEYNNPWQTIGLTDRGFSAAEFYHYKVILSKPAPKGLQLYIGNEEEEKDNSGQTVDVKPGTRIVEGDFNVKDLKDGDLYIRMFRMQYTGDGKATVGIKSVELTDENEQVVAQRPREGTWNFEH